MQQCNRFADGIAAPATAFDTMNFSSRAGFSLATIVATLVTGTVLTGCGRAQQTYKTVGAHPTAAPVAQGAPVTPYSPVAPVESVPPLSPFTPVAPFPMPETAHSQAPYSVPPSASQLHSAASPKGDYQELHAQRPGQAIDLNASLVSGKRTIVEVWSPSCGP